MQYTEYTELYANYAHCPDNVTLTVVKNDDKTWNFSFTMKDSGQGTYDTWGSGNTITIEWRGPATKYSGRNKNDLTDADY